MSSSEDDDARTTTTPRVGQRFRCSCCRCCRVENEANDVTPLKLTDDAILLCDDDYASNPKKSSLVFSIIQNAWLIINNERKNQTRAM